MLGGAQFLCAAIMAGSVIIFPLVTRHITGEIIPNKQFDLFMPWVLLGLGSFFLKDALNKS